MYRNYIFDFYGTLADIRTDEEKPYLWEKMSEIYSAFGASYTPEELGQAFRKLEREEAERAFGRLEGNVDKTVFNIPGQETGKKLGAEEAEPDLRRVFARLYEQKGALCDTSLAKVTAVTFRALSRDFLRVYDGVRELLGELKRQGKGVYLLSNAQTDFTRPEIEMLGLTGYFDGIFISSEQGCRKPSPLFFHKLLERFGLDPAESIMIGNDEEADIAGANRAGMDSLYIHTAISPKEYGRVEATYRVMDGDFRKIRELVLKQRT